MTNEERMVRALDKIAVSLDGINKTLKVISKNKANNIPSVIHDLEHVEEREDSNE